MAEKSTLQDPYADEIIVAATSQNPQDALLKMVGVESATLDKV
jgi:hypothetical protein